VEKNVKLEVLDWGGSGEPLVLLAGPGNSAHIFDKFAPSPCAASDRRPASSILLERSGLTEHCQVDVQDRRWPGVARDIADYERPAPSSADHTSVVFTAFSVILFGMIRRSMR